MIEWKYLWSEPFKARSILAAHFVRDCKTVIELGGYKTPMTAFLPSDKKVIVIDPRTDLLKSENHQHLQIGFENWTGNPDKPFGVVILGIELHLPEEAWQKLFQLIEESEITVIEVPIEHCHSVDQFSRICSNTTKKVSCRILLDLSDNDFGDMNGSAPPKCLRQINVLSTS